MSIDEKTKISLFAVLGVAPFVVATVVWFSSVDAKATSAKEEVSGLKGLILDIRERVIRIEEQQKQKLKE